MTSNAVNKCALIKVTVAENEVTAGSLVKGTIHVDGSCLSSHRPQVTLRLGLVGREVAHVHRGYHDESKTNSIVYKEGRIFLSRKKSWEYKELRTAQQHCHENRDDGEDSSSRASSDGNITMDFAFPLPNELPSAFEEEMPLDSPIHFPWSKCRVEYFLQASLVQVSTKLTDADSSGKHESSISSEPCILCVRRLIHQVLHNKVSLQIADLISRPQFVFCGLFEQNYETFVIAPVSLSEIHWSPTQQPAVTICLSDPHGHLKPKASGTYRLQVVLVQRIAWQAQQNATLPLEESWTLEPFLFWKGGGDAASSLLVDGEIVLPTTLLLRESYMGQLVQVEHHVVFSMHQKTLGATEWSLVGSSTQIPLLIQR